jgi:hypothetical protein
MAGRAALTALCDLDGRVLINAELIPVRPAGRGWHVSEIAARFNEAPEQELEKRFRAWVSTIPGAERRPVDEPLAEALAEGVADVAAGVDAALEEAPSVLPVRASRRAARPRLLEDAGPALAKLTRRAWDDEVTDEAARVLAELTGDLGPEAALTALRRLGPGPLAGTCRNAIARGAVDLADLWDLTAIRPLRTALDGLDPSLHHRFGEQLVLLTGTAPLPGSLRKLVRRPQLAPAYSMGLVGLRLRAAIGRLLLDGDRAIIPSVTRRPARPMLCALTVHLACAHDRDTSAIDLAPVTPPRIVTVPGFPESALSDPDGPWQRAFPEARELGSDTGMFWDGIAEHGLRVPAAWVAGGGGWPVLWARAHHTRPRARHKKATRGTRS